MATCIPRVDGLSTDPRVGASHAELGLLSQALPCVAGSGLGRLNGSPSRTWRACDL